MLIDLHTHSQYSYDAKPSTIAELAASATARGFSVLSVTDHKDLFRSIPHMDLDLDAIMADIDHVRNQYAGELLLLKGIELGQPHVAPAVARELLAAYPFDMVIGSLHAMPNDIDLYFHDYDNIDCDQLLHEYFQEVQAMVQLGGFDVLAHIDYPLRVMKRENNQPSFARFMEEITPIFKTIIDREIALEINAAGLFGWQKHVGPENFVLAEYRRLGGTMISIGSDAHSAQDIGRGIEACIAHAKKHGFDEVTIFEQRKPRRLAL